MAITLGSPQAKTIVAAISATVISIKSYSITGFSFQNTADVVTLCQVNYQTLDVSGNVLESLSASITNSNLTTLMSTLVTAGQTRENEIRNALYAYMVAQSIFV